jgi:hypothetical protein
MAITYEDEAPRRKSRIQYEDEKPKERGLFESFMTPFTEATTAQFQAATDLDKQRAAGAGFTLPYRKTAAAVGQMIPGVEPAATRYARRLAGEEERLKETEPEALAFGQTAGLLPTLFTPSFLAPSIVRAKDAPTVFGRGVEYLKAGGKTALKTVPYGGAVSALTTPVPEATGMADVYGAKPMQAVPGAAVGGVFAAGSAALPALLQGGGAFMEAVRRASGGPTRTAREKAIQEATQLAEGRQVGRVTTPGAAQTLQQRGEIAAQAQARAEREAGTGITGMPGVRTGTEMGVKQPVPATQAEIGDYIRKQADNFLTAIKGQRDINADRLMTAARGEAMAREEAGDIIQNNPKFRDTIKFIDDQLSFTSDPTVRAPLETIKKALLQVEKRALDEGERRVLALRTGRPLDQIPETEGVPTPFRGIEVLRRKLGDAAFGMPTQEGYQAIGQDNARKLYGLVSESMKDYAPSFSRFLEDYRRLSAPLEVFNTRVGRALVQEAKDAPNYYMTDAAQIANTVFGSRDKTRALIDAFGGNKEPVVAAARQFFANQLDGKTADSAAKFLQSDKIRQVTQELGLGDELFQRYVRPVATAERRAAAAGEIVKGTTKQQEDVTRLVENLKFSPPDQIAGNAKRLVDYLRVNRLGRAEDIQKANESINEFLQAQDKQAAARRMLIAVGGAAGLGYFGRQTISGSAMGD